MKKVVRKLKYFFPKEKNETKETAGKKSKEAQKEKLINDLFFTDEEEEKKGNMEEQVEIMEIQKNVENKKELVYLCSSDNDVEEIKKKKREDEKIKAEREKKLAELNREIERGKREDQQQQKINKTGRDGHHLREKTSPAPLKLHARKPKNGEKRSPLKEKQNNHF